MKVIFFLSLVFWGSAQAGTGQENCFVKHINEAIELNIARREVYAEQSKGKSKKISDTLIWLERLTWLSAKWFDWRARFWQEQGIPLMCSEFVSMDLTPSLAKAQLMREDPRSDLDIKHLAPTLSKGLKNSYENVFETAVDALKEINLEPYYHCMQRHMIESIGRTAKLAPIYEKMAFEKGLKSPSSLIKMFLQMQIWGLKLGKWLDEMAMPLQKQGLGIICQDVPHIALDVGIDPPQVLDRSILTNCPRW